MLRLKMSQTNYVDDLVCQLSEDGLTQDLRDLMYDDAQLLSDLGVNDDRQRNLAFYLENFCDDLCEEFGYQIKDKRPIIMQSYSYLMDADDVDLTKIRAAVLKTLRGLSKKKVAYPNTTGVSEVNVKPERDVGQWIGVLGQIYEAIRSGENRENAFIRLTKEWSPMEKRDFEAWARYYEKGDHEKYNIKTASNPSWYPISLMDEGDVDPELPVEKPRMKEKTPDDFKKSLLSRLNSAERLLYNFVNVWPNDVYSRLHQGLSDLKREIMMMRTTSSMRDRIIRTASIWERTGFVEGAQELMKIAQPPTGDITTEIEKALTGREFEGEKEKGGDESPVPGGEEMPPLEEVPPPGEEAGMEGSPAEESAGPPAGVEEPLPPAEEPPGGPPPEESGMGKDNPYASASVQDVLEVLEPLSQKLREREFIRDLSKVDMMLDALNIASHFPELGEAQAKALELNIYVGTRVERVISKLKGGLKEEGEEEEEKPPPPDVEMGELSKGPEETAFEVTEEGGPPPPVPGEEAPPTEKEAPLPPLER